MVKLQAVARLKAAEKKEPKTKTKVKPLTPKKPNTTRGQDKWLRMQKRRTD